MPPHNRASNVNSTSPHWQKEQKLFPSADLGIPALKAALALRNRIRQDKVGQLKM